MADCPYEELRKYVLGQNYKILTENPEFLTMRIRTPQNKVLDFACCRKDVDYDGRRPGSVQRTNAEEDLSRRDFRMNAMAMRVDPLTLEPLGELLDPFGGQEDIKLRVVRFVGDPKKRLEEDGLRWLRAIRFSITLGFLLDQQAEDALRIAPLDVMAKVHPDRIREELQKCFGFNTHASFKTLNKYPLLWLRGGIWLKPTTEAAKLR